MQAEPTGLGRHVFSIKNSDETIGAFDRQPQRPQMGVSGRLVWRRAECPVMVVSRRSGSSAWRQPVLDVQVVAKPQTEGQSPAESNRSRASPR